MLLLNAQLLNFTFVKTSLIVFAFLIVLKPVYPVLEYIMDYEYISEVLCINKDKPEMHCNGKCYLMKSLAEAAEKEADQKKQNLLKKVDIPLLYVAQAEKTSPVVLQSPEKNSIPIIPDFYSLQITAEFFHPPLA